MPPMIAALKRGRYANGYWLKDQWWLDDASDVAAHRAAPEHGG